MGQYEKKLINWLKSEFKNRKDFSKKKNRIYRNLLVKYKDLLDLAFPLLKLKKVKKWTLELCKLDALNYKTKSEWSTNSTTAYVTALKNKWLKECTSHMHTRQKVKKWDLISCIEDAKNYKSLTEWSKLSGGYRAALRNNWLEECTKHMTGYKKITIETCKQDALKYKTKKDWRLNSLQFYRVAQYNNWLEECTKHMKIYILNNFTKKIFCSMEEASKENNKSISYIWNSCNKTSKKREFVYCDENGKILVDKKKK